MPKLVLFDIDGTLVLTGGAGLRAMNRACLDIVGHADALDGIPVLDQEFSAWKACMQAGLAAGAVRAIGPQNIGRFTATDDAHKDHVHLDLVV